MPRFCPYSLFDHFRGRFSIHRHYSSEYTEESYKAQRRKSAKENKMNEVQPVDPMDIDSNSSDRNQDSSTAHGQTFLEDEKSDDQFEFINHETLGDVAFYTHPNKAIESISDLNNTRPNNLKIEDVKALQFKIEVPQNVGKTIPLDETENFETSKPQIEANESNDLQLQFSQLRSECEGHLSALTSKIINLELSTMHPPPNLESRETSGDVRLVVNDETKEVFVGRILDLEKSKKELEEHIQNLVNVQEPVFKHQAELERRVRAVTNQVEKEKHIREENEFSLQSEITALRANYQKEKERAQKLMKTMAEMQSADPFKVDNTSIASSVRELRYDIKNWARAQRLLPSLPAQGSISTYATRVLGGKEKGPNYDFLKMVTPVFHEYTESPQDLKWVIQAYVWKRIGELVFEEDNWAGIRKPLDDEEVEYKLCSGYRLMKLRLIPEDESNQDYIAQFHEWRSNSARILAQRISAERRQRTVKFIRDDILRPLYKAVSPMEQEIHNVEDLEAIIESAMRLGASIAQQKAFFRFEFLAVTAVGRMEFKPQCMMEQYPPDPYDSRTHARAVWLNLEPRLLKHGTSEGTNFDSCVQLLEAEVETRVVPRKFAVRRQGV